MPPMPSSPRSSLSVRFVRRGLAGGALLLSACSTFGAVYPPRPPGTPGAPVADPTPSRIVAHVTVTNGGLRGAIDDAVPRRGDGSFPLLRTQRRYTWDRAPFQVSFSQGRVVLETKVQAKVD